MRKSKNFLIILGMAFVISFLFVAKINRMDYLVQEQCDRLFFSYIEEKLSFKLDFDGDGREERVGFFIRRFSPDRQRLSEGYMEVLSKGKKKFQASMLGNKLEMADICDVNKDGKKEIICKWLDGNAVNLHVFHWDNGHFKELFSAGGREVKLADVDGDGTEEIIEYWRDHNKEYDSYVVNIYKWDRKAYVLMRENVPVEIDSQKVDRLILGKGKFVLLR